MYGIMTYDGCLVLCKASYQSVYVLSRWDYINTPVMIENSLEVDKLHQEYMVHLGNYTLKVFEFSKDDEARLIIRRLKGY